MSLQHNIYEQHAEEASFLWSMRDRACADAAYTLADLCEIDERVEAHLDGLRLGGKVAWEVCLPSVEEGEPGMAFAATAVALDCGDIPRLAKVLDAVAHDAVAARGIASAIGWVPWEKARKILPALVFHRCPPPLHYLGIAGAAAHRMDPGAVVATAIHSVDDRLRERGLWAVGECRRTDLLPEVVAAYQAPDERCRLAAAWSAALLGDPSAADVLWRLVQTSDALAEPACGMLMRLLTLVDANRRLRELRQNHRRARAAIAGAAALGDPGNVAWLLSYLQLPPLARLAASAIATIIGVDLTATQMEAEQPEGFEVGPTDDADDDNVTMDADESLPWPDTAKLQAYWRTRTKQFKSGRRYLLGVPMTPEWLERVLWNGRQPVRASAAVELTRMQTGRVLKEVRAPGFRQMRAGVIA